MTRPRLHRRLRRVICVGVVAAVTTGVAAAGESEAARRAPGPSSMEVITAPSVPGLTFTFGGQHFVTDSRGAFVLPASLLPQSASTPLRSGKLFPSPGFELITQQLRLPQNLRPGGVSYALERVYIRFRQRAVVVGGESVRGIIRAAIDAYVPVRFAFLERRGNPVNPSMIRSMTIKRSDGAIFTLTREQLRSRRALRMQASRVVALSGGLVSKPLGYRIQSVLVGGNNVVNRSQQGFTPLSKRRVNVKLLFYSLKVKATDRLFGLGVGSGFTLVLPNGAVRTASFGSGHSQTLPALPRGSYRISANAWGVSGTQPLSLTRDQVVDLKVFSYFDIAFAAIVALGVAIGLMKVGRGRVGGSPARADGLLEPVPALAGAPFGRPRPHAPSPTQTATPASAAPASTLRVPWQTTPPTPQAASAPAQATITAPTAKTPRRRKTTPVPAPAATVPTRRTANPPPSPATTEPTRRRSSASPAPAPTPTTNAEGKADKPKPRKRKERQKKDSPEPPTMPEFPPPRHAR